MLQSITELMHNEVIASDGEFGKVTDVFFDDEDKSILFVVIETAQWLANRQVVIPYEIFQFAMQKDGLKFPYARKEVMSRCVRGTLGGYAPFGN